MTIADFLILTKRSWRILIVSVLVGLLAGAAYGFFAPKVYAASSAGFITASGTNVFGGTEALTNKASSYLPLITSQPVLEKIAADAKVDAATLRGSLSASIAPNSTLMEVTAKSADPKTAATLANGALDALASVITDIQTKAGVEEAAQITVIPMQNAVVPTSPISPNLKLALAIGGVAGLVLGYIIVFLRRALDVKVRTGTDLATLAGSGLLGRIPKINRRKGDDPLMAIAGEPLRQIRAGLRFAAVDGQVRTVVVTSASQSEGKSTIAAALARVMAEEEQPTLLIDGDLRRPTVARTFGIDGTVGLSEVLSGQVLLADAIRPTNNSRLLILPAGGIPPNPSEMMGSTTMKALLETLARDYVVIIDAPPLLPVSDALLVSADVDGVVFVAAAGRTRKAEVTAARELLTRAKVRMLGVILNMVPPRDAGDGYSYYRQYRSYYTKTEAGRSEKKAASDRIPVGDVVVQPGPRRRSSASREPQ